MSCNCQGLGEFQKRRDLFQYLRQQNCSIYFLQDTHFVKKLERRIRSEWGYESYFSSYTSQGRGVAILFNNNFDFKINEVIKDQVNGNYLIINLTILNRTVTLINIYGPNRDTPEFFTKIQDIITRKKYIDSSDIIWGGDWNLVLNPNIDYMNYKHNNNPQAQEKVLEIKDTLELADVWREINSEISRFTWRRKNPFQQGRLDFFLTSETLLPYIKETDIIPGYRTDHSFITLELEFKKESKQKTYWKFNSSLLKDTECIKEINDTIDNVIKQYAIPGSSMGITVYIVWYSIFIVLQ